MNSSAAIREQPASAGAVVNLAELVSRRAQREGQEVALVQADPNRRTLTWAELDQRVAGVAAGLAHRGLLAGHRLALLAPNTIEHLIAYLAALRAGLAVVPISGRMGPTLAQDWMAETRARLLLASAGPGSGPVTTVRLDATGLDELAQTTATPPLSPADPEGLAVLLRTAGTSEKPRTVMLTHRALLSPTGGLGELAKSDDPAPTVGLALPLSGAYGLVTVVGTWLLGSGRLVLIGERGDIGAAVRSESITHLPVTPPILLRLLRTPGGTDGLSSLRTVVSAGARLPWSLAEEFRHRTGRRVDQGYGLTETGPGVSTTVGGDLLGPGHVGRPLPGVEVRIGDGRDDGEPAEIQVRGPGLFSGYWPDGADAPLADGWWGTGDIGYRQGAELFLLERAREVLTVNGFHVYPAEIEQVITEVKGVEGVAVVGATAGPPVVAFVSGTGLDTSAIADHCRSRLPRYKRPADVRLMARLPRTPAGTISRTVLREIVESHHRTGSGSDVEERAR